MKTYQIMIKRKNGETVTLKVSVEDLLASWLDKLEEKAREEFLLFLKREELRERKEMRKAHLSLELLSELGWDVPDFSLPDEVLIARHLDLRIALDHITDKQRYILDSIFLLKKNEYELAKELGVTQTAIAQMKKRAINHIKKKIQN